MHRWWVIRLRVCSGSMYLLLAWLIEIKATPSLRYCTRLEFEGDAGVWFTDRSIPMKESSFQRLHLHVIEFKRCSMLHMTQRRACSHRRLILTIAFLTTYHREGHVSVLRSARRILPLTSFLNSFPSMRIENESGWVEFLSCRTKDES
jgi:hypothetical protein